MKLFLRNIFAGLLMFVSTGLFASSSTPVEFNNCVLHGTYAYKNVAQDVASFGVIKFDGNGNASLDIRINARNPGNESTRRTVAATGSGAYRVGVDGIGHVALDFRGIDLKRGVYDFVLLDQQDGIATTIFSVLRDGGVNGQLVDPTWTLLQRPDHTGC